jgi:hypothetical protein
MVDITKCKDFTCPVKDKCKRFTTPDGLLQSYFLESPKEVKNGKVTCKMFWGDKCDLTIEQLFNTTKK